MNVTGFTPTYSNVRNNNVKNNTSPAFQGVRGDKFVREIATGKNVTTAEVMEAVKGTFGPKSEKVTDVVESLLESVKSLTRRTLSQEKQIAEHTETIAKFPREKQDAVFSAQREMGEAMQRALAEKNAEIAKYQKEAQDAKIFAEKYEPVVKVKSVEELDVLMPPDVMHTMDVMIAGREGASASMFDFLMTGEGQQRALDQIERANVLMKARQDGIFKIPEVAEKLEGLQVSDRFYPSTGLNTAMDLIGSALRGNPQGAYVASPVIKNQVRDNAMAVLTPLCDNKYHSTATVTTFETLDRLLDDVVKFHNDFAAGMKKLRNDGAKVTENRTGYDLYFNKVKVERGADDVRELNFWQVSNYGASNWS